MTIARQGPSLVRGLLFGLLFGLGVLAKLGVIGLALPYLLVMGWLAYRKKSPGVWQSSLASLAMISVLDGWLLVRNRLVYGDPLTVGVLDYLDGVRQVSWHWIAELGVFAGKSFFVDFGPGAIGLANDHVYAAFGLVMLAGLLGAIAVWRKYPNLRCELSIMGCWLAVMIFGYFRLVGTHQVVMGGGRLILPASCSVAGLVGVGLSYLGPRRPSPLLPILAASAMFTFATLAIPLHLLGVVSPRPEIKSQLTPAPDHIVHVQFGGDILLAGYDLSIASDTARVRYMWLPQRELGLNYSIFLQQIIHRASGDDSVLSQLDTYPGYGAAATSFWVPNRYVMDEIALPLVAPPTTLTAGEQMLLATGLYDAKTMKRLQLRGGPDSELLYGQALIVGRVALDKSGRPFVAAD